MHLSHSEMECFSINLPTGNQFTATVRVETENPGLLVTFCPSASMSLSKISNNKST